VIGDDAGSEHVSGGDWSHVKAPQDSLFAKGHESDAQTPEGAHHGQRDNRTEQKANGVRITLGEDRREEEKETEGHDQAEEHERFVAQGQAHAHDRESQKVLQSRSLLPVGWMKTSSREGGAV